MAFSFSDFGNDLYNGRRSIPVVPKRKIFYIVSVVLIAVAALGLGVRGLNLGLEFRGGSEFRVTGAAVGAGYEAQARDAVATGNQSVNVTRLGTGTVRVQTERLDEQQSTAAREALAETFDVPASQVSGTFIGPSWGDSVSQQAFRALIVFLVLTAIVMALYFRTWKMSLAAMLALAHDLVITVGLYALLGFEVSPASMIGFMTVLGYSIYDTVVVFDKVRENTQESFANGRMTFTEAANLAVNQTVVRSINTTVIAALPILAVLLVGFLVLGPGVLLDLALVLFVGVVVGAYSSIFLATPLLVSLRSKEKAVVDLDKRAARSQAKRAKEQQARQERREPVASGARAGTSAGSGAYAAPAAAGTDAEADADHPGDDLLTDTDTDTASDGEGDAEATVTGRQVHRYARSAGPRNQPRRTPKSKRK